MLGLSFWIISDLRISIEYRDTNRDRDRDTNRDRDQDSGSGSGSESERRLGPKVWAEDSNIREIKSTALNLETPQLTTNYLKAVNYVLHL